MPEIFVTLIVVAVVVYVFWWLCGKLPAPVGPVLQIVALACGAFWLILNVRELIHAFIALFH